MVHQGSHFYSENRWYGSSGSTENHRVVLIHIVVSFLKPICINTCCFTCFNSKRAPTATQARLKPDQRSEEASMMIVQPVGFKSLFRSEKEPGKNCYNNNTMMDYYECSSCIKSHAIYVIPKLRPYKINISLITAKKSLLLHN